MQGNRVCSQNQDQQFIAFWFKFCEQEYRSSHLVNISGFLEGVHVCADRYKVYACTPKVFYIESAVPFLKSWDKNTPRFQATCISQLILLFAK